MGWKGCEPRRNCDWTKWLVAIHDAKFFYTQSHLLNPNSRSFGVGIGHNQYKFFSTVATRYIIGPCVPKQENADFVKHRISRRMTEGIVEALEVVYIEHCHTQRLTSPRGAVYFSFQGFFQVSSVEQASQSIADGLASQSFTQTYIRN